MTTPGGSAPDGAFEFGSAYGSDVTQASFDALVQGQVNTEFDAASTNFADGVLAAATNAYSSAVANADALARMLANQGPNSNQGVRLFENFPGANVGIPTAAWELSVAGSIIETGGTAALSSGLAANGYWHTIHKTSLAANDQSATVVIGSDTNSTAGNTILVRATSTGSAFVYAYIKSNTIHLGRGTWIAGAYSFTQWATYGSGVSGGATVTLEAMGNKFTVYRNGYPVIVYTDVGNTAPSGAAYQYAGMMFQNSTPTFIMFAPARISSFSAHDATIPATIGTGWTIFRAATAAGGDLQDGYQAVLAGTYDNADRIGNISLNSMGIGQITVLDTGWYMINLRFQYDLANENSDDFKPLLYSFAPGGSTWELVDVGASNTGDHYSSGATFIRYCYAGEGLLPGIYIAKGGVETPTSVVGDTLGTLTYFKGALLNN